MKKQLNTPQNVEVTSNTLRFWINNTLTNHWINDSSEYVKEYVEKFNETHNTLGVSEDKFNLQIYTTCLIDDYLDNENNQYNPIYFDEYGIIPLYNNTNIENGFYFVDKKYLEFLNNLIDRDRNYFRYELEDIKNKCFRYIEENKLLYLTIWEFNCEFSPKEYESANYRYVIDILMNKQKAA
mgnify:CR=1 FL=1